MASETSIRRTWQEHKLFLTHNNIHISLYSFNPVFNIVTAYIKNQLAHERNHIKRIGYELKRIAIGVRLCYQPKNINAFNALYNYLPYTAIM